LTSTGSSIGYDVNIFLILFHKVFFPGVFLEGQTVGKKLPGQGRILADLVQVKMLFLPELIQNTMIMPSGEEVITVEKHHPDQKSDKSDRVFIKNNFQNFPEHVIAIENYQVPASIIHRSSTGTSQEVPRFV